MYVATDLYAKERPLVNNAKKRKVKERKLVKGELSLRKLALTDNNAFLTLNNDVWLRPAMPVVVPVFKPLPMNYLTVRQRSVKEFRHSLLVSYPLRRSSLQFRLRERRAVLQPHSLAVGNFSRVLRSLLPN